MMDQRTFAWSAGFAVLMMCLICTAAPAQSTELKLSDCPTAVQKTLKQEANGAKIDEVEKEIEDGETTYEADVTIDEKEYEITVAADGTLLEKALADSDDEDDGDEDDEVEIKLSDCPAVVQKTLKREAHGAEIDAVDKSVKDGKAFYEVDVKIDGKNYEIRVSEEGTLIWKALDEEDE